MASRATLRQLSTVIAAQQDWLAWIRTQLPPELAPHVANAVAKGAELVVLAESAAWSTRLRYALAGLDEALTARDPTMTGFAVRVQPPAR